MNKLTPIDQQAGPLATSDDLGDIANAYAAATVFQRYQATKAHNTNRRHRSDLANFCDFLATLGKDCPEPLFDSPSAWQGITWGLVDAFLQTMIKGGYAVRTVNLTLGTIKRYAAMAHQAGPLADNEAAMIRALKAYSGGEARRLDEKRDNTRLGDKKPIATKITPSELDSILGSLSPDSPQGRRDRLAMLLLAHHGLRVSELSSLATSDFDPDSKLLTWFRPKTGITSTHVLRGQSLAATIDYVTQDAAADDCLFRGSVKTGELTTFGWAAANIAARVRRLGRNVGIDNLSPHDLRHYGATQLARQRCTLNELMAWGGWKTPAIAMSYIEAGEIDNEGVSVVKSEYSF